MTSVSSTDSSSGPLSYHFANSAILNEALTHKSYVNERRDQDYKHNERLEFLGDAVLSLIISDYLAKQYPALSEGALSKLKATLVSEATLATVARRLDLGSRLKLGRGEERSKGREKASLLADALEAVIAAVYLDGGFEVSRDCTIAMLSEELRQIECLHTKPGGEDSKTRLQEWCQRRYDSLPQYVTVRESGPDHEKVFEIEVHVNNHILGRGAGRSKKEAEQAAARQALEHVER